MWTYLTGASTPVWLWTPGGGGGITKISRSRFRSASHPAPPPPPLPPPRQQRQQHLEETLCGWWALPWDGSCFRSSQQRAPAAPSVVTVSTMESAPSSPGWVRCLATVPRATREQGVRGRRPLLCMPPPSASQTPPVCLESSTLTIPATKQDSPDSSLPWWEWVPFWRDIKI